VILLDTSICVELLRGTSPQASRRLLATDPDQVRIPAVAAAELLFGARRGGVAQALEATRGFIDGIGTMPFGASAAESYGAARQALAAAGTPIGPNDLLIAATALSLGATLATANTGEFARVPGLAVENWRDSPNPRPA
jgi:tRNA(fMet)-specific endonuclease VapC